MSLSIIWPVSCVGRRWGLSARLFVFLNTQNMTNHPGSPVSSIPFEPFFFFASNRFSLFVLCFSSPLQHTVPPSITSSPPPLPHSHSRMATTRAFSIPEILQAIVINIPLFHLSASLSLPPHHYYSSSSSASQVSQSSYDRSLYLDSTDPKFLPVSLLNCCLVCKSWRDILMPVLWRCYDERFMRRIPYNLMLRYRSHIRYFRGGVMPLTKRELEAGHECKPQEQQEEGDEENDKESAQQQQQQQEKEDEDQCRSLVELDVFFFQKSGWGTVVPTVPPPAYARVLQLNRHLRHVRLVAHGTKPQLIDATALLRCLRLTELRINSFTTQLTRDHDLGRFLGPTVSTLTHLTLIDIRGAYHLDTTSPTSTTATPLLWFPNMVEFTTDLSPTITPGIEKLIARCPNLERLCLCPEPSFSLEPLAGVLLQRSDDIATTTTCCPKIRSLRFLTSASRTNQIHKVIEACGPLSQLEYTCSDLTIEIQHATRAHRDTLEHLRISIIVYKPHRHTVTEIPFLLNRPAAGWVQTRFLQEVIDSFLSLRTLAFRQKVEQAPFARMMMEIPWRCDRLEELQLVVGTMEQHRRLEMEYLEPGRAFAHGWRIPLDARVDIEYFKPDYELFEKFLDHVSLSLPKLRKLSALRVNCVR